MNTRGIASFLLLFTLIVNAFVLASFTPGCATPQGPGEPPAASQVDWPRVQAVLEAADAELSVYEATRYGPQASEIRGHVQTALVVVRAAQAGEATEDPRLAIYRMLGAAQGIVVSLPDDDARLAGMASLSAVRLALVGFGAVAPADGGES